MKMPKISWTSLLWISISLLTHLVANAQCPDITVSTLQGGCFNGSTPCDLCPGEVITLKAGGVNLPDGGCLNWYYSDTQGFDPYAGEGTLIGCGDITSTSPPPCSVCPEMLSLFIDACGPEGPNEFMLLGSGSGFNVNSLQIDFATQNNTMGATNNDINVNAAPCGFKTPDATLIANIQASANCDGTNVIPVGPGGSVPAGAIVLIFTSGNATTAYDFDALCATGQKIYVLQNSCNRTIGAFTNGPGPGTRTTSITIGGCTPPCTDAITYDLGNFNPPMNGDYVLADGSDGNGGCVSPVVTATPVPTTSTVDDVTLSISELLCNGGPYYIVGIINPAPTPPCDDEYTNEFVFNVVCPEAAIVADGPFCFGGSATLDGSGGGTYVWTGPAGFNSISEDPVISNLTLLKSGTYNLTVTNAAGCTDKTSIDIVVDPDITVTITPANPTFCAGNTVTLNGSAAGGSGNFDYEWQIPGGGTETGQTIDAGVVGIYTLIVTDSEGCSKTKTINVNQNPSPDVSITPNPVSLCAGQSKILTADVTGGTPPYFYDWETPNGNFTINTVTADKAGNYAVTVTDNKGCTSVANIDVTVSPQLNVNLSTTTLNACFGKTLDITATTINGVGPFTYSWNTPGGAKTGNTITADVSGNYAVTSTDSNGCTGTNTIAIVVNTEIVINLTPANPSFCPGSCVTLNAGATGGTSPYQFLWSGGQTLQSISACTAGNYCVTVTDGLGCTAIQCIDVTQVAQLIIEIEPINPSICLGGSVDLSTKINGGSAPYSYVWLTPSGNSSNAVVSATLAGSYFVTVTDANGCTGTASTIVTISSNLPVNILPAPAEFCKGKDIVLTADSPAGGTLSYLWTLPGGSNLSGASITAIMAGNYTVTVSNGSGCSGIANIDVTELALPVLSIDPNPASFCTGGSVDLSANVTGSAPYSYQWIGPSINASTSFITVNLNGIYVLTVTDSKGCAATASIPVSESNTLGMSFSPAPPGFCKGQSINLSVTPIGGSSPFTYVWTTPAGPKSTASFPVNQAGVYSVIIKDSKACEGQGAVLVNEFTNPVIEALPDTGFCFGKSINIVTKVTDLLPPLSYSWTSPLGVVVTQNISNAQAGAYTLVVTNSAGCSALVNLQVTEWPAPIINLSPDPILFCQGTSTDITATITAGNPPFVSTWTGNGLANGNTFTINQSGIISLSVIDSKACTASKSTTASSQSGLIVDLQTDPDLLCGSGGFDVISSLTGGKSPFIYAWTTPSGNQNGANANGDLSGIYSVIVTDSEGCSGQASVNVNNEALLPLDISSQDPSCDQANSGSIVINSSQSIQFPAAVKVNNQAEVTINNLPFNIGNLSAGNYDIVLTDKNGCSTSGSTNLVAPSSISLDLGPDVTINLGENYFININTDFTISSIIWTPANTISCPANCTIAEAKPTKTTTYTAQATDDNGCVVSDNIKITVIEKTSVFIPNVFSSNADGTNDKWVIFSDNTVESIKEAAVFDRWGESIWYQNNFPPNDNKFGWDGRFNGKYLNPCVLVYYVVIEFKNGQTKVFKGDLNIFR